MKRIVQIIDQIQQGFCEPILCGADDGLHYYVKHVGVLAESLIREWLAARIAREIGLPVPSCAQLFCSADLARYSAFPSAANLALAPCFGSQEVPQATLFTAENHKAIPDASLPARILLLDWWLMNADRTEGNPNLLWVAHEQTLFIIDHNLAFDAKEPPTAFWEHHIFRCDSSLWDQRFRCWAHGEMQRIGDMMDVFWNELPQEWIEAAPDFTLQRVRMMLDRWKTDPQGFWTHA